MTRFNFYAPPGGSTGGGKSNQEQTQKETACGTYEARSRMAENLLQVNVFFQTLNVQTITEDPKYEVYCI